MSTIAPDQAGAPTTAAEAPATPAGGPLAISSLVLGLVSIFAGWTFFAPIVGLITGILALSREPNYRTMAIWGIALNAVVLAGVIVLALVGLVFGLALLPFAFVM